MLKKKDNINSKANSKNGFLDTFNTGSLSYSNNLSMLRAALKRALKVTKWVAFGLLILNIMLVWSANQRKARSFFLYNLSVIQEYIPIISDSPKVLKKYDSHGNVVLDYITKKPVTVTVPLSAIRDMPKVKEYKDSFITTLWYSAIFYILQVLTFFIVWNVWLYKRGVRQLDKDVIRGSTLEPNVNAMNTIFKKRKMLSDIKIGGLHIIKDTETRHIALVGTTGTGKTLWFKELINHIRHHKSRTDDKMIIMDVDSEFCNSFYNPKTDVILNPFDSRCAYYNFFDDIHTVEKNGAVYVATHQVDTIAKIIVPEASGDQRFWADTSRILLSELIKVIKKTPDEPETYKNLINKAININIEELEEFLKGTAGEQLVDKSIKKTALSMRVVLLSYMKCFETMLDVEERMTDDTPTFTFDEWVRSLVDPNLTAKKNIFITYTDGTMATLKPLITYWIAISSSKIKSLPRSKTRKIWNLIDEFTKLGQLPDLSDTLATARNYGYCIVAGFQNYSQVRKQYGSEDAQAIISLFSTAYYFRSGNDEPLADEISKNLGSQDIISSEASKQFGIETVKDGGSINVVEKSRYIVTSTEIMQLDDRIAYVSFPASVPRARIKLKVPNSSLFPESLGIFLRGIIFPYYIARTVLYKLNILKQKHSIEETPLNKKYEIVVPVGIANQMLEQAETQDTPITASSVFAKKNKNNDSDGQELSENEKVADASAEEAKSMPVEKSVDVNEEVNQHEESNNNVSTNKQVDTCDKNPGSNSSDDIDNTKGHEEKQNKPIRSAEIKQELAVEELDTEELGENLL